MALRIKNINGHEYAYDVKTVWNKETRKYKKQTKYLGTVTDKETKTFERKRNPKIIYVFTKFIIVVPSGGYP